MYSTSPFYAEEYFGNEIPLADINKYFFIAQAIYKLLFLDLFFYLIAKLRLILFGQS